MAQASKHYVYLLHWDGKRWWCGLIPDNYPVLTKPQLMQARTVLADVETYPYRNRAYLKSLLSRKKKPTNHELPVELIEHVMGVRPEVIANYYKFDIIEWSEMMYIEDIEAEIKQLLGV